MILKQWFKKIPLIKKLLALRNAEKQLKNTQQQLTLAINQIALLLKQNIQDQTVAKQQGIIISLTSFGERINTVHLTLLSLLSQSVQAEKIILWLSENEVTRDSLPQHLLELENQGISIAFCKELGSYKKLIPCLQKYPNKTIITFDDDVIYANDQVEKLLISSKKHPSAIVCHHARKIVYDKNNRIKPYKDWPFIHSQQDEDHIIPIGVGGILYPSGSLDQDVIKDNLFLKLAPKADDLWFKCMALKKETTVIMVDKPKAFEDYLLIPSTQDNALWLVNRYNNDQQLKNILQYYPEINNALHKPINHYH